MTEIAAGPAPGAALSAPEAGRAGSALAAGGASAAAAGNGPPPRPRAHLRQRLVVALLAVSLLPLALLSLGSWRIFGGALAARSLDLQRAVLQRHATAVDAYLEQRVHLLQFVAESRARDELADPRTLAATLAELNRAGHGGFVDLGVIGPGGDHLAYVGPYDLAGRNYREAEWFGRVAASGLDVSDVFLGYRQVPHCIIACKAGPPEDFWVLRATIDSDQFDALVRTASLGATGETFILNREGLYQSRPRDGALLDRFPPAAEVLGAGAPARRLTIDGRRRLAVAAPVNGGRWFLVALQDEEEVLAPVARSLAVLGLLLALAVALVVSTTVLATRHLVDRIEEGDRERSRLLGAFLRSARLASIGELATGLAHEINNPLAIIGAQQTNVTDLVREMPPATPGRQEALSALERAQRQVHRCGGITAKMLQFGRKQETALAPTELEPVLRDTAALMHKQASVANVALELVLAPDLPPVVLDRVELEQVLVNLIKNALDALGGGGKVEIAARRQGGEVLLEVRDDGPGIAPDVLGRIFEPFFTTKPVGKGTGLGLSVCYGLVQSWGGSLEAESGPGGGTVMRIRLPARPPAGARRP